MKKLLFAGAIIFGSFGFYACGGDETVTEGEVEGTVIETDTAITEMEVERTIRDVDTTIKTETETIDIDENDQ